MINVLNIELRIAYLNAIRKEHLTRKKEDPRSQCEQQGEGGRERLKVGCITEAGGQPSSGGTLPSTIQNASPNVLLPIHHLLSSLAEDHPQVVFTLPPFQPVLEWEMMGPPRAPEGSRRKAAVQRAWSEMAE